LFFAQELTATVQEQLLAITLQGYLNPIVLWATAMQACALLQITLTGTIRGSHRCISWESTTSIALLARLFEPSCIALLYNKADADKDTADNHRTTVPSGGALLGGSRPDVEPRLKRLLAVVDQCHPGHVTTPWNARVTAWHGT
jgi:hypothetical protein